MEQGTLWDHLPLLVRANSNDSVESILQTLWRTRKTGVDAADRATICQLLQLENDSDLDPKFQNEWREDLLKEQVTLPRLRSISSDQSNTGSLEPAAVSSLKFQNEVKFDLGEAELNSQVAKHNLEATAKSMHSVQDKFFEVADQSIRHVQQDNTS